MEKKLITVSILIVAAMSLLFVGLIKLRPDLHGEILAYYYPDNETARPTELVKNKEWLVDSEGASHSMRLEIPFSVNEEKIVFDSDFYGKSLNIELKGVGKNYPTDYPVVGDTDGIKSIEYTNTERKGNLIVSFENFTEIKTYKEGRYIYLDFLSPHDIYDKIVVLDPGHGGKDLGAAGTGLQEKDINLQLANKLNEALINLNSFDDADGREDKIGVYLTRNEDVFLSPEDRVEFAEEINPELFISLHLNSTTSDRREEIYGTEVLYYSKDPTGEAKALARKLSGAVSSAIEGKDRGILAGDDIYILRNIKQKAVLCEVGFITNTKETEKIKDEKYQEKLAEAMAGIITEELK